MNTGERAYDAFIDSFGFGVAMVQAEEPIPYAELDASIRAAWEAAATAGTTSDRIKEALEAAIIRRE